MFLKKRLDAAMLRKGTNGERNGSFKWLDK